MKSTFCLATGERAVLSSYVGDLLQYDVFREYEATIERLCALMQIEPEIVCYDLHPSTGRGGLPNAATPTASRWRSSIITRMSRRAWPIAIWPDR